MSFKTILKSRSAQQLEEAVEDYKRQLSYDESQLAASIENGYKLTFTDRKRLKDLKYQVEALQARLQEVRKQNNQRQATYRARNNKGSNGVDAAAIVEATIKGTAQLFKAMYPQGSHGPHGSLQLKPMAQAELDEEYIKPGKPTGNRFIDLVNIEGKTTEEAKQILEDEARAHEQAQNDELMSAMRGPKSTIEEVEKTIKDSIADIDPTDI